MKYIVKFSQYGLELGDSNSKSDLQNAFVAIHGGPQNTLMYLLTSLNFIEDTIKEIEINDNNRLDSKTITN